MFRIFSLPHKITQYIYMIKNLRILSCCITPQDNLVCRQKTILTTRTVLSCLEEWQETLVLIWVEIDRGKIKPMVKEEESKPCLEIALV